MSENKKYYWLKLKESFFDEKLQKYIRTLPDGDKLLIAYLKMQLKSLRTEGLIKYDEILPAIEEELAMILDEDVNTIKLLLPALEKARAIEILEDGSIYMLAMQDLIGKEGKSAERVRNFRARQKQKALQCNANVTICNTESEIELEIEDGWMDINNYFNNKEPIQNITPEYNEIFKNKQIYFDNFECIPERLKNQIKLYQIAVKSLVDTGQLEILESVNLKTMEKIFGQILKAKNISNLEKYFIASLCNEVAKEDR